MPHGRHNTNRSLPAAIADRAESARPLIFSRRAVRDETLTARRRTWRTLDGRYRVVESVMLYAMPTVIYAQVADRRGWAIISRHRSRSAAEAACRKHSRQQKAI